MKREYFLTSVPDPSTLEVSVEDTTGATLEFDMNDDYTYSDARNSVTFVAYIPNSGARIVVHYVPAD